MTPAALMAPEPCKAGLGTCDTGMALTFCSRKPRSRERAHSRKEREQVRITTTSNRSRKLLSPVGNGPWVEVGWLGAFGGQGCSWARPRGLQGWFGLVSRLMGILSQKLSQCWSGVWGNPSAG